MGLSQRKWLSVFRQRAGPASARRPRLGAAEGLLRGAGRRHRRGARAPRGQARAGHVPESGRHPRRTARGGSRLRGRPRRSPGRPRGWFRPGDRSRPRRPGRRPVRSRRGCGGQRRGRPAVIKTGHCTCEPWRVREVKLDLDRLGQSESIFALSNGHIGWRANLDEGEPHSIAGSYLNAVYEELPIPYAEPAFGYPEAGQTMVNVTDGNIIPPLAAEPPATTERGAVLIPPTGGSKLRGGAAMEHIVGGPRGTAIHTESTGDDARLTVTSRVRPGERLRLVKFVAYAWSSLRTVPAMRSQVEGALAEALKHGCGGLASAPRRYLADFWSRSDVELEGDDEVQQAMRFAMFHVLQAAARAEQRAIPAKGLTGPGDDGHTFWDMASFVLPVLTYPPPHCVPDPRRS